MLLHKSANLPAAGNILLLLYILCIFSVDHDSSYSSYLHLTDAFVQIVLDHIWSDHAMPGNWTHALVIVNTMFELRASYTLIKIMHYNFSYFQTLKSQFRFLYLLYSPSKVREIASIQIAFSIVTVLCPLPVLHN